MSRTKIVKAGMDTGYMKKKYQRDLDLLKSCLEEGYLIFKAPFDLPDGSRDIEYSNQNLEQYKIDFEKNILYTHEGKHVFDHVSLGLVKGIVRPVARIHKLIIFKFHYKLEEYKPALEVILVNPKDNSPFFNPKSKRIGELEKLAETRMVARKE